MRISGKTKVCGLIGDPVEHSLSPALQNAAFQHLGLDYVYVAFTVRRKRLEGAISGMRSLGFRGLNVTMPYKIEVIQYLDELDETAENVGSVNTVLNKEGSLIGYTTDGTGALNALRYNGVDPSDKKVVLLGAGGASRSVSFTLAKEANDLVILNRTLEKAENIVNDLTRVLGFGAKVRAGRLDDANLERELRDADILVNATSVGMRPREALTPADSSLLRSGLAVFDLVYEPLETRLLREARMVGAKTVDGLTMLTLQGAASFEIWTELEAPIDVMMEAAAKELKEKRRQDSTEET
ncbi:MAG: shikimate dehydrogenase [Candidatus Bathyarchaeota archaeon]|nr:shikimate dehydrogenase [Candidatus Bathyarchaeota archaeon]